MALDRQEPNQDSIQGELFPEIFAAMHGPQPEVSAFPDYPAIASWVANRILNLHEEEFYPLAEIAVIYTMRSPEQGAITTMNLPHLLQSALDARGILNNWIAEDYRAKCSYDVTTESVTISTIHNLKGFDYACAFVLGLDWLEPGSRWNTEQIRKLAYVAVTRAREQLFIPYRTKNHLIEVLIGGKI